MINFTTKHRCSYFCNMVTLAKQSVYCSYLRISCLFQYCSVITHLISIESKSVLPNPEIELTIIITPNSRNNTLMIYIHTNGWNEIAGLLKMQYENYVKPISYFHIIGKEAHTQYLILLQYLCFEFLLISFHYEHLRLYIQ